jgi:hypothetical protein
MSPNRQTPDKKGAVPHNLYTVILTLALCIVVATAALVAYKCKIQYDTFFKIP